MKTIYHTQTITRICAFCGAPFIGHPHRDYCSPRCKRKAKEQRYKTGAPEATPEKFYSHEYGTVTPSLAHDIFQFLRAAEEDAAPILIKNFTAPDETIIPGDLTIFSGAKGFTVCKNHGDDRPTACSVTEELERTTVHISPTATITIVPPPKKSFYN